MIVGADYRRRRITNRGAIHLARMRDCGRCGAGRDLDLLQQPILYIDAQDPEFFDIQSSRRRREMCRHRVRPVQEWCHRLRAEHHPACEFSRRGELRSLEVADAFQATESSGVQESRPATEPAATMSRETSCNAISGQMPLR